MAASCGWRDIGRVPSVSCFFLGGGGKGREGGGARRGGARVVVRGGGGGGMQGDRVSGFLGSGFRGPMNSRVARSRGRTNAHGGITIPHSLSERRSALT